MNKIMNNKELKIKINNKINNKKIKIEIKITKKKIKTLIVMLLNRKKQIIKEMKIYLN